MSLTERWDGLSAGLRRGLVLAGAVALILALASLLVSAPTNERGGPAGESKRLITNLLTNADPRAIGIEGLAERLRRLESHMDQVAVSLEKLGLGKGVDPERDALIEALRRENAK
jgi:conjugal transfer pilus assembly protein TraB